VILAVVDDLMFTSKVRAAANQLGAPIVFARSAESAFAEMRKSRPSLVILDLDNPRTNPLGIVSQMKEDAELSDVETLGFVSHVKTDLIDAARQAGVRTILPRSAFAQQLPEILARAR
jgi:PleD family two-component response regulator